MHSLDMEKGAIEQTYASLVSNIFDNFVGAYTAANSAEQQEAVKKGFRDKISHIRRMKDIAIASLPA